MAIRAIKFRKKLNGATGGSANYIFLGDLNAMGLDYPYNSDIDSTTELKRWDTRASQYCDMRRLSKTQDATWSNGSTSSIPDSNLDHVFASKHLLFKQFTKPSDGTKVDVDVRGWVNQPSPDDKDNWIEDYSDHCLLYFEVQKV